MIKIFKTNCNFFLFFLLLTSLSSQTMSKNIIDVIKEDSELSIFYSNLKKTGLDEVLQKKLPCIYMRSIFSIVQNLLKKICTIVFI